MTNANATAEATGYMHEIDGSETRHKDLDRSGLFARHTGVYGGCPIEFEAYLPTGEYLYFKARETKYEIYVLADLEDMFDDERHLAHYRKKAEVDTGRVPTVIAVQQILNLTRQYIQQRDAANPPKATRSVKKPKTTERPVRLAVPKILAAGPEAQVVLNFAHHQQCACRVCVKTNVTRRPGRRNGTR